jgi:hypothetical protein
VDGFPRNDENNTSWEENVCEEGEGVRERIFCKKN